LAKFARKEGFALAVEPSFFLPQQNSFLATQEPGSDTLYAKVPSQPLPEPLYLEGGKTTAG